MTTQTQRRPLTSARVLSTLSSAIIPALGTNRLKMDGQGNPYVRDNGTAIHIFNLNAFASAEAAKEAAEHWKAGTKLEKAGDVEAAQEEFRAALNLRMSFSVLAENASDFQQAYEINCLVEEVLNSAGEKVIGINRPRAVAVEQNGSGVASLFTIEEEPATAKKGTRKTAKA